MKRRTETHLTAGPVPSRARRVLLCLSDGLRWAIGIPAAMFAAWCLLWLLRIAVEVLR
jgi:hypothetical protein